MAEWGVMVRGGVTPMKFVMQLRCAAGLFAALLVFFVCGTCILLFSLAKRMVAGVLGVDAGLWAPFPNGPRFWCGVITALVGWALRIRMQDTPSALQHLLVGDARTRMLVLANHPTDVEFPFCYSMIMRLLSSEYRMLSTQAGWDKKFVFGPVFDLAGSAIFLHRKKDGYEIGTGARDMRQGLSRLWKEGDALVLHPDSSRPSPARIAVKNEKYGSHYTFIMPPKFEGVYEVLQYLDREGVGPIPVVFFTSGFGFQVEPGEVWKWYRVSGATFYTDVQVVMSSELPRDRQLLFDRLNAWAAGCDSKLAAFARRNGFVQ